MVARHYFEYRWSALGIMAFSASRGLTAGRSVIIAAQTSLGGRLAMRFTWTGLILAPLLMPALLSAVSLGFFQADRPVLLFLFLLVLGCIVSYGATIFLFLPCLFLLSLWRPMTGFKVCLLGLVLGAAVFVPLTWMEEQRPRFRPTD
jgi:hypothetical protein